MASPIVQIDNASFRYGDGQPPVFQHFSWQVEAGEMWAVLGTSGCGKSTLLALMSGVRRPDSGRILVDGMEVTRPRATIGLILQNHGLLPWATVWQNAALGLRIGHFYRWKRTDPLEPRPYPPVLPLSGADQWLDRLGIGHLGHKYPSQLSGGQQQRVAIARTLTLRPHLLLMDEPFSALDAVTRRDLQGLVLDLRHDLQMTSVIVTHNIEEATLLGRRILVLQRPPNQEAEIVENPGAGTLAFQDTDTYHRVTHDLRKRLSVLHG